MTDSDPRIGWVLDDTYTIEARVSEELLGRVYRGRDVVRDRDVLVKVLHEHLHGDDARFGRFLREVRASSMVQHINTIEILDSGVHEGQHFLVMEFFESSTLEDALQEGPLAFHRVAHIAAQMASAIGAAHQESVTHRALSPRNVLLLVASKRGDFVKIRDFGLSKLERFGDDDEASHLTEAGVHVGNTAYMAPEYIERDRFHPKGDLYALGCVMMTMLTSEPPFTGRGAAVLGAHVADAPPRPSSRRSDVPDWLDDLVMDLLEKKPEKRPGAYQVVQRLEEGIGHKLEPPGLGPAVKPIASAAEVEAKQDRSRQIIAAITGLVLVGLTVTMALLGVALFGLLVFYQPETASPRPSAEPAAPSRSTPADAAEAEPRVAPPSKPTQAPTPSSVEPAVDDAPAPVVDSREEARRAQVRVRSNRRALVTINGRPMGMTPITEPLLPGVHTVKVMLPGEPSSAQERKVNVERGLQSNVVFTF